MKLKFILMFILPLLGQAAELLRNKDEDSTGVDDEAAKILDAAVTALAVYLKS